MVTEISLRVAGSSSRRVDGLNRSLRLLQDRNPNIEASALTSDDGLMLASDLTSRLHDGRVAGMSARMLSLGNEAARDLARGVAKEVVVRGDGGYAIVVPVGSGTLLTCLTTAESKLGLVLLDMRRAADDIRQLL